VLRRVLRKSQGIQTTEEESKRANQILKALLEEYKGAADSPVALKFPVVKAADLIAAQNSIRWTERNQDQEEDC